MNGSMMNNNLPPQQGNPMTATDQQFFASLASTGPHGGTSITSLKKGPPQQTQIPHAVPMQYKQQSMPQIPQQIQHVIQDNSSRDEDSYCGTTNSRIYGNKTKNEKSIRHLVNDLNSSLNKGGDASIKNNTTNDTETSSSDDSDSDNNEGQSVFSSIFGFVKEALLLVVIYAILSQAFVRRTIGTYIPQIIPVGDQPVTIVGHLIYGSILAIIFCVIKRAISLQTCR
jgi:hypothetical protein